MTRCIYYLVDDETGERVSVPTPRYADITAMWWRYRKTTSRPPCSINHVINDAPGRAVFTALPVSPDLFY